MGDDCWGTPPPDPSDELKRLATDLDVAVLNLRALRARVEWLSNRVSG